MNKRQVIQHAKKYMDLLSKGIDPISQKEVGSVSIVAEPRLQKCFAFISLFEDVFGAEKTGYLYSQYPFFDIYQDSRFADFLLENGGRRVAIEIDDDASHLPGHVSQVKH